MKTNPMSRAVGHQGQQPSANVMRRLYPTIGSHSSRKLLEKLLTLLALLTLIQCSASSTSAPISTAPTSLVHAPPGLPTAQGSTPTINSMHSTEAPVPAAMRAAPTARPAPTSAPQTAAPAAMPVYSYPIGLPGRAPGDGFFIRDGYAVENTWYHPGWWHTAEDWYVQDGSSVGARVSAVADGEVVYAGANYPGRVVIVKHADGLFSMYGHLDPKLAVKVSQPVARGDLIGTVGPGWDRAPGHLHFEIRTFLTAREVNGAAPRYDYRCGVNCPPGPGYWPIKAPEHPSAIGWRNPTHVIAQRAFAASVDSASGEVVVVTKPISPTVTLWSDPPGSGGAPQALGEMSLRPGERFALLDVQAGPEDSQATSAAAYQLWYRIGLADGRSGWVQAAVPSARETGADGRPDSVFFNMVPAIPAAP